MSIEENLIQGVDGIFYITIATLFSTGINLLIRYCYKSRCVEVECCCFKIRRDPRAENKEDLQSLTLNVAADKKV